MQLHLVTHNWVTTRPLPAFAFIDSPCFHVYTHSAMLLIYTMSRPPCRRVIYNLCHTTIIPTSIPCDLLKTHRYWILVSLSILQSAVSFRRR